MATGQYDNAWETPGWTTQWGYYQNEPSVAVVPPTGLKNVVVTGSFFDDQARPMNGVITFTPSVKAVRVNGATVILREFRALLVHGQLVDVNVISPDGTQVCDPPDWSYRIRQRVGPSISEYDLFVPAGNTVDVYSVQSQGAAVAELPLVRNFLVIAGATFRADYLWTQPSGSNDISAWTARMQIRTAIGGTLLLELTETSGITLGTDGSVAIEITAAQSATLRNGVYDMELYQPAGDTFRFLEGSITVDPNVTV